VPSSAGLGRDRVLQLQGWLRKRRPKDLSGRRVGIVVPHRIAAAGEEKGPLTAGRAFCRLLEAAVPQHDQNRRSRSAAHAADVEVRLMLVESLQHLRRWAGRQYQVFMARGGYVARWRADPRLSEPGNVEAIAPFLQAGPARRTGDRRPTILL